MVDVREQVQDVFRQVFGDDSIVLRDEMTADDIEGWDSLMHINLVIAIEKRFGIKLTTSEIARMKGADQNIKSMLTMLATKTR